MNKSLYTDYSFVGYYYLQCLIVSMNNSWEAMNRGRLYKCSLFSYTNWWSHKKREEEAELPSASWWEHCLVLSLFNGLRVFYKTSLWKWREMLGDVKWESHQRVFHLFCLLPYKIIWFPYNFIRSCVISFPLQKLPYCALWLFILQLLTKNENVLAYSAQHLMQHDKKSRSAF